MAKLKDSGLEYALSLKDNQPEEEVPLKESLRRHRKAVFWSLVVSLTIIMDGFDGALTGSLFAQPAFKKQYGERLPNGDYSIPALWQTLMGMGAPFGRIIGGLTVGYAADKLGRKSVLIISLLLISGILLIVFMADSVQMLTSGLILCGIMWGVFNTLVPTYVSEVCPMALRDVLTAYINLCWVLGQMMAQGVMLIFSDNDTEMAYKIPFALQWVWPVVILIFLPFAPESPWWLVRKSRHEDARKSLKKLLTDKKDIENYLATMIITDHREKTTQKSSSFLECFRNNDLYRTEISCMAWSIQALSGNVVLGYTAYFFERAGFSTNLSFILAFVLSLIGILGTIVSWFLTNLFGRRSNYLYGLSILAFLHLTIGFADFLKTENTAFLWVQAFSIILWAFVYDVTIGPVCYVIVTETSSTRLKEKTVSLATIAYSFWGIVFQVTTPYMLNPAQLDLSGKVGFFFAALCIICLIWCIFRLPELQGRTYDDINILFAKNLRATEMKDYIITQKDREIYTNE